MKTQTTPALYKSDFPELNLLKRGKVRDLYDMGDALLLVATDRLSAFDVVMPDPIPEKGKVLTQISLFWFEAMAPIIKNHLIASDVDAYPDILKPHADVLEGRSMLVKKVTPFPIECVVRGYLSGSGWKSYQKEGHVCGIELPKGLTESDQLPTPLFTPSTKEDAPGKHDENIDFKTASQMIGQEHATALRDLSLEIYQKGVEIANQKGIIIADTKFEFGLLDNEILLIDEVLTPDSSRFWPKDAYQPGGPQVSFDKQYIRDYLLSSGWDKASPAPTFPPDVIAQTTQKYLEALERITK